MKAKRHMNFESMEKRELFAADLGMDLAMVIEPAATQGTAEIDFVEVAESSEDSNPKSYLKYKLDRCWVKSWSTSGDADDRPAEEVAFYYNKIAFGYASTSDGEEWKAIDPAAEQPVDEVFATADPAQELQYKLKDVMVTSYN